MANECSGTIRIVSPKKETFKRLTKIANYDDKEYFLSRIYQFAPTEPIHPSSEKDELFVQDFVINGAWNCSHIFTDKENENLLCNNTSSTAKLTNLCKLAKLLDFGAELFADEIGFEFCEHYVCDHNGDLTISEVGDYKEIYPKLPNGKPDLDADYEPWYELPNFGKFMPATNIYQMKGYINEQ